MAFKKGQKRPEGAGRRPGVSNTTTQLLKDAILLAAEQSGEGHPRRTPRRTGEDDGLTETEYMVVQAWDWDGTDGLVGYLRWASQNYPKQYLTLLGRVLPLQLKYDNKPHARRYLTAEEISAMIEARGLPMPKLIEHRPNEYVDAEVIEDDDYEPSASISERPRLTRRR